MATGNGRGRRGGSDNAVGEATAPLAGTAQATVASVLEQAQSGVQTLQQAHASLMERRAAAVAQAEQTLQAMDAEIETVVAALAQMGSPIAAPRGRRRGSRNATRTPRATGAKMGRTRASNESNLPEAIQAYLKDNGPAAIHQIMAGVQAAGYQTTADSASFRSIVQQVFTNFGADFKRDGSLRTNNDGSAAAKKGTALFVRVSRGVYDNLRNGDTAEKVEARGARFVKQQEAETPAQPA